MKNQKFLFIILPFFILQNAVAQNDADAIRYSMLDYGSTARSLGMGNSFGALGADFSTLATNPAGIALYRRSEVSLSPLFINRSTESDYLSKSQKDSYFKFAFGNFGAVFAGESERAGSRWKGWAFGVGYNRLNDFSGRSIAEANNPNNSLIDHYLEQLEGVSPEDISTINEFSYDVNLAWQTFLIDTVTLNGQLFYFNNAVPFAGAQQRRTSITKGGQGEWDFSFGANYDDKLYIGITLGLTSIHYEEDLTWEETDNMDTIPFFNSFRYSQHLKTSGSGFNVKLGAIYKPNDVMRIGLAIHTPTYYSLTDEYRADMESDLENGQEYNYSGPAYLPFTYDLTTPFRTIGSIGVIILQQAAINIDYEFLDYSLARLNNSEFQSYFNDVNDSIRTKYGVAHNFRIGGEYRYDELRFRLGGQYSTSPFTSKYRGSTDTDLSKYTFSGGFGIKEEHYFIDFAYAYSKSGSLLLPYTLNDPSVAEPIIKFTQHEHRFLITAGITF